MTDIDTKRLGEIAYTTALPNGLTVITIKKPGFQKKAGLLAVNYGSIHTRLPGMGTTSAVETPAGVAHFLEHKMFDMPDGRNVLQLYGELGASPNAYTSHAMTAYHFETTERFDDCLSLLLEYVYTPYYTQESVDKEQGIIGQELSMYRDMPGMRLSDELMALTYINHPVRLPIGGTHESISRITKDTLYDCYNTFYTPANMVLCVAGDVEAEEVTALAERLSPKVKNVPLTHSLGISEPAAAGGKTLTVSMDVPMPLFEMAVKLTQPAGVNRLTWDVLVKLASECLSGMSTPLYSRLYEGGLIDAGFGFDPFLFQEGGCLLFMGQSREPEAVRDALLAEVKLLLSEGIPEMLFERVCRSCWGARVRTLDIPMGLARQVAAQQLAGCNFFDLPDIFDRANTASLLEVLSQVTEENTALVIIRKE